MSKIYWNDPNKNFSKTHEFGADITKFVIDSDTDKKGKSVNDPRLESWLRTGKVTKTKPESKEPRMGEVASLKAQVSDLQEKLKVSEFDENQLETLKNKIVELEEDNSDSGITQDQLDLATATSVQGDLDKIAELVDGDVGELQDKLDLIKAGLDEINPADNRPVVDSKIEEIKNLFEGE